MTKNVRLFEFLKLKGISQADFAKRIGATRQQVTNWKTGTHTIPDKYIIATIKEYSDIDARWLITGKTNELPVEIETLHNKIILLAEELLDSKNRIIQLQDSLFNELSERVRN